MPASPLAARRFLFGTNSYNAHAQQMALALDEAGALAAYVTSGVDSYRTPFGRAVRRLAAAVPGVDRELSRRAPLPIDPDRIRSRWLWELARVAASRAGISEQIVDRIWERQEWSLDRACARQMQRDDIDGFIGVEHGALAALGAARRAGKPAIVTFMSPHHAAYERWVQPEYATFPELDTESRRALSALAIGRDARRDREARLADWVVTGSYFTTRSLVDAGISIDKILTVPLAGPPAVDDSRLPATPPPTFKVVYVGGISVAKGAHYLLSAWKTLAPGNAELHCYGRMLLPEHVWRAAKSGPGGESITFHGSIPARELPNVYLTASLLVLPTLYDGYGLVVSEALAHGLPVITTTNAGSADAIDEGRTGFVIAPADDDALTATLQYCIAHPREIFAMRKAALTAARQRTWKVFRGRFIEQLAQAVGHSSSASPESSRH